MEKTINSFDQTKLYMKTDFPEKPKAVAVIVHGLCEHQGRYDHLVKQFNESGIACYRFDHRGHGRSEGERAYLSTFHELVDDTNVVVDIALAENPMLPVFLVGHSMGGFTVSLYGAKYPDKKLKGIVTSGALVRDDIKLVSALPKNLDPHTSLPNELGGGVCSVQEVVDWYGKDPYNGMSFTAGICYAICEGIEWFSAKIKDFSFPTLILHGENDGLVSESDSIYLFKKISSKDRQLKIYGGMFHEIFNEYIKEEVIDDVISWIKKRI